MENKNTRILLVENAAVLSNVIMSLLANTGHRHVTHVGQIDEAWSMLTNQTFDLIICEWELSKGSGLDLLKKVREKASTKAIPFILVSDVVEHNLVSMAVAMGVTEYLVKPFNMAMLEEKISLALRLGANVSVKESTPLQNAEGGFNSSVALCCETESVLDKLSLLLKDFKVHTNSDFGSLVNRIRKDKSLDVILVEESVCKRYLDVTKTLVNTMKMGQVEIILLSDNTSESHIEHLQHLGFKHIIHVNYGLHDVPVKVDLLQRLKKSMLNTNIRVRELESEKEQTGELQAKIADNVITSTTKIRTASTYLSHVKGISGDVKRLTEEIDIEALTIDAMAKAITSLKTEAKATEDATDEDLPLQQCFELANSLFTETIGNRKLAFVLKDSRNLVLKTNPTLFNSLFMFLVRGFLQELNYASHLVVSSEPDSEAEADMNEEVRIEFSACFPHIPHFKELASKVTLDKKGHLHIQFNYPIKRLIERCRLKVNSEFSMNNNHLRLILTY